MLRLLAVLQGMQQHHSYNATIEASEPTCTHAAPCTAALSWSCTFDPVELQNVDPSAQQKSTVYLAKNCNWLANPHRLWKLSKSSTLHWGASGRASWAFLCVTSIAVWRSELFLVLLQC